MEKTIKQLPLHTSRVDKLSSAINRTHTLIHSFFISILLYHRFSLLFLPFTQNDPVSSIFRSTHPPPPLLPTLLIFLAELILSLLWLSEQAFHWRPVNRTVFVDRLPEESQLPPVDVFICTADPDREPTVEVMNTVVSAMALDYPPDKCNISSYLKEKEKRKKNKIRKEREELKSLTKRVKATLLIGNWDRRIEKEKASSREEKESSRSTSSRATKKKEREGMQRLRGKKEES